MRFLQEDGADVAAGEPFVEVEAMKMIMPLKATESGKINHEMSPGSIIAAGDLLASLQLAVRGGLLYCFWWGERREMGNDSFFLCTAVFLKWVRGVFGGGRGRGAGDRE